MYYRYDISNIKYLSANVVGNILLSFLLMYSLVNLKKCLILFYASIPVLTWYTSVFFIEIDFLVIKPFLLLLLVLNSVLFFELYKSGKFTFNKILSSLAIYFFLRLLASLFYVDSQKDALFVLNEFLEPFLFSLLLVQTFSFFSDKQYEYFNKIISGLFTSAVAILAIEMVFRSGGKPWQFILYGGRRHFAGTTGDLTAGLGEPVTMGIFSAFFLFYFIFISKQYLLALIAAFVVFLSLAKSAFVAVLLLVVLFFLGLRKSFFNYIKVRYAVLLALISLPLIYKTIQRFFGVGSSYAPKAIEVFGLETTTSGNLYSNVIHAITWLDDYFQMEWYYQFILLPFAGGVKNIIYLDNMLAVFCVGLFFNVIVLFFFIAKGNIYTQICSFVFLLIFNYYGGFTGNPYAFFYVSIEPASLGYVPRTEPYYLLMLILASFIIGLKHFNIKNSRW